MRDLIPDFDDFLDAIWDFDESWYNAKKATASKEDSNEEFQGKNLG